MNLMNLMYMMSLQARDLPGRCKALLTFINITRWVRTLHHLRVLPPRPTLMLLEAVERPSPFQGRCASCIEWTVMVNCCVKSIGNSMPMLRFNYAPCLLLQLLNLLASFPSNAGVVSVLCPPTVMTLHLRSVEKRVSIPTSHLQGLLDVYGMLSSCNIPGAISCERLKVRWWGYQSLGPADILFAGNPSILSGMVVGGWWVD